MSESRIRAALLDRFGTILHAGLEGFLRKLQAGPLWHLPAYKARRAEALTSPQPRPSILTLIKWTVPWVGQVENMC